MKNILSICLLIMSVPLWAQNQLKILTFNVYAKPDPMNNRMTRERLELICEQLSRSDYDVVMLQEVWTKSFRRIFRNCGFEYVMDLRKTGSVKREKSLGSGLMILSRYPLLNQQRKILVRPKGLRAKIFHGEGLVRKSVYVAQIETPSGRLVSVANTHLVANYCSETRPTDCVRYDRVRESQFRQASEFVLQWSKGTPMVFGGDFNFGPHVISADPSWNQLDEILPGFRQADFDPTADQTSSSSNSFNESSMGKIDHLFVSPELSLVHGAVVFAQKVISRHNGKEMNLSDHYGWETTVVVD